jgi:hypothetical protein
LEHICSVEALRSSQQKSCKEIETASCKTSERVARRGCVLINC